MSDEEQWRKEWTEDDVTEKRVRPSFSLEDRLPDRAKFHASYDSTAVMWTATLIADINGEPKIFSATGHGIFPTLMRLDRQYREAAGLPKRKKGGKVKGKRKCRQL